MSGTGKCSPRSGQGLFDFGYMDGPAGQALLQHPLGVCALRDGSVLMADTYNGAVRRLTRTTVVSTVADGLAEPSDLVVLPEGGCMVVESAAHRLTRLAPGALAAAGASTVAGRGIAPSASRPSCGRAR